MDINKEINSWEDLQNSVDDIVIALNANENLKIAAACNPILALEELGYTIDAEVLGHVEDKIRFKTRQVVELSKLRKSIQKISGKNINIRSIDELNTLLFEDYKLQAFDDNGCLINKEITVPRKGDAEEDDLLLYQGLHPIIDPLLKFRRIDASVSSFCDKYTYKRIRGGGFGKNSNIKLSIRMKKDKG